tara:strand:- start:566 stop:835 length:270 start_codon:yes stop_codon:yes gene_type:complete
MKGLRIKQTAHYDGKKIPLPFLIAKETLTTKMTKVRNRFGGEETELPEFAVAVYDIIMGSEMLQDWKTHRQGLDWFIKYFPKQYMVLLD